jgi:hypothetical protein
MRMLFCYISILFFIISNAQFTNLPNFDEKNLKFGYFIGTNTYDYKILYKENPRYPITIERGTGLNIGLIGELKINKNLNLSFEPGLYSNNTKIIFNERLFFTSYNDTLWNVKSSNIHLPILIKYNSKRLGNFKPYLQAGVSTSLNLGKIEGSFENYLIESLNFADVGFYYELGFGIDFYLRYFKFSPSLRGVFSIKNELPKNIPKNPWTGNIDRMFTRAVFINLSFY